MLLKDVINNLMTREDRKAARIKIWKRPWLIKNRQAACEERLADWRERYGNTNRK